jgi:hypothetical protein
MSIPSFNQDPADTAVDTGDDAPPLSWRHRIVVALGGMAATLPRSWFPARYARQSEQSTGSERIDRVADRRRAALLGVNRMPLGPGLWVRTTWEGHQEVYRVKDQNGEMYATVGCLLGVAVPACSLPGYWDKLG